MQRVKAFRITAIEWTTISDWLEGFKYHKTIKVEDDVPVYNIDMDFIDARVGDWVVVWSSGATVTYSAVNFDKHFTHVAGDEYDTPWTPLFNAERYSRPIIN